MKHVKVVTGLVICLQILSACSASDNGKETARIAKAKVIAGKQEAKPGTPAADPAPVDVTTLQAFKDFVDPTVQNLKGQDAKALGLINVLNTRKWSFQVLGTADKTVLGTFDLAGKHIAFQTKDQIQIDNVNFTALSAEERGLVLMEQIVAGVYLDTKLAAAAVADPAAVAAAKTAADPDAQVVNKNQPTAPAAPVASKDDDDSDDDSSDDDSTPAVASATAVSVKKEDYAKIHQAALYLFSEGRSAKLADITKRLKDLGVIN